MGSKLLNPEGSRSGRCLGQQSKEVRDSMAGVHQGGHQSQGLWDSPFWAHLLLSQLIHPQLSLHLQASAKTELLSCLQGGKHSLLFSAAPSHSKIMPHVFTHRAGFLPTSSLCLLKWPHDIICACQGLPYEIITFQEENKPHLDSFQHRMHTAGAVFNAEEKELMDRYNHTTF